MPHSSTRTEIGTRTECFRTCDQNVKEISAWVPFLAKNQAKGKINVCKIARLPVLEIINITTGYFLNQYAHGLPPFRQHYLDGRYRPYLRQEQGVAQRSLECPWRAMCCSCSLGLARFRDRAGYSRLASHVRCCSIVTMRYCSISLIGACLW